MSQLLLHGFVAWFYIKFMAHDTCRDARHFFRGKSKDVAELCKGGHDILPHWAREVLPYFDVFSFEYVYLFVSFYGARPFLRVGVLRIHAHDTGGLFFPFPFGRGDGSSSF